MHPWLVKIASVHERLYVCVYVCVCVCVCVCVDSAVMWCYVDPHDCLYKLYSFYTAGIVGIIYGCDLSIDGHNRNLPNKS